ncbi:hypothetical protein CYMTET_17307 [Cymbomonas tetramitiformis]|uniref:Uncharacterized protein n=1 Tax=Cymbomonas tetramitiformis TaxID=36881 RepID=A0AAE0GAE1_9CHLO|nr:hypothetical protein CYMTET_17307 [Cymbomonas tetramitiformis]
MPARRLNSVSCIARRSVDVDKLVPSFQVTTPPSPPQHVSSVMSFCRTYWPAFAVLQVVALIGASYNGYISRKRREELQVLYAQMRIMNEKLRQENDKDDEDSASPQVSEKLSSGMSSLQSGEAAAAVESFTAAAELASKVEDLTSQRRAWRGVATAQQQQVRKHNAP